jgi:anti-sigma regulatory factor (Ser/Thr protein kinase)
VIIPGDATDAADEPHLPPCESGRLQARPESVPELRHVVVALAERNGVAANDRDRIALAVTEAAANVVVHAYAASERGWLRYVADLEEGDLQVIVSDDGGGIRAERSSDGLGLGLRLIAELTDDFAVNARDPQGLEVWMRFVVAASPR